MVQMVQMVRMPNDPRRNALLCELARSWAGTGPARPAWSPQDVALVWPALADHRVEVALGGLIPTDQLSAAQARSLSEARERSRWQLMELERFLPALTAAAGAPILLKGAGLALAFYPDPTERWFVDLDLLVPRARIEEACAALEECGYRPYRDRQDWAYYDRYHLHRILIAPTGSVVELHWALTVPDSPYRFELAGVQERARFLRVGKESCRVAAPVDLVTHGVYQDLVDGFGDLRRQLDLALVLPRLDAGDWRTLAKNLEYGRMERGFELSLHIMKSVLGLPAPAWQSTRPLGRTAWRLLDGLDPAASCLERRAMAEPGYNRFLHLILVPDARLRRAQARRLLWPRLQPVIGQPPPSAAAQVAATAAAGGVNLARLTRFACRALASPRR